VSTEKAQPVYRVLTVEEAAERLRISRAQTFRLIRDGQLDTVKIGSSRRVPVESLDEYIERLKGAA
jgi:excisionase family DNA binding protein